MGGTSEHWHGDGPWDGDEVAMAGVGRDLWSSFLIFPSFLNQSSLASIACFTTLYSKWRFGWSPDETAHRHDVLMILDNTRDCVSNHCNKFGNV